MDHLKSFAAAEFIDSDWTPVNIYSKLLRVVAIATTRIFIGKDLCHNEEWLQTSIAYTMHLASGARSIKNWKPWLRPLVYRWVPDLRVIYKDMDTAVRLLTPIVKARRESEGTEGYQKPNDMLQWMMDRRIKTSARDRDYEYLARIQLTLAFAAIHTTTMSTTNMIYDLGAMPEYIDIIRQEINEELPKNDGRWDGRLMKALKKTDSFMKESQRHNPIGSGIYTGSRMYVG